MNTATELFPAAAESEPTSLPKWIKVTRCLTAECEVCHDELGEWEDEGQVIHFADMDEVRKEIADKEWTHTKDGLICPDCAEALLEDVVTS